MFTADNYNPLALIKTQPEASKLLDVLDDLPGYVDAVLQTLLQPEKVIWRMLFDYLNSALQKNSFNCRLLL